MKYCLFLGKRRTAFSGYWGSRVPQWMELLSLLVSLVLLGTVSVGAGGSSFQEAGEMVKQSPDGAAIFAVRCLLCHGPGGRASQLASLAKLKPEAVYSALSTGVMRQQAVGLEEAALRALTDYIASFLERRDRPAAVGSCPEEDRENRSGVGPEEWNGWSPDVRNTRFQPSEAAGLSSEDIHRLQLNWAFVFPDVATAANQPTIVDGRLYIGSWDGTVYALDARSGCVYWTFKADAGVRTAVTIADGRALFGDFLANVYAVDTSTGKLRWRKEVDPHPQARITGSPVAYGGSLYVPVSSIEEGVADDPAYPCCTFRGSVVALETSSGRQIWKTYTIDEAAQEIGVNPVGTPRLGPSGVAVWSAPTVDAKRNLLFVATGNNYTEPDVAATDAVIALELQTGTKRWVRSLLPSDRWNAACLSANRANCPPEEGPDFDFGASPVLVQLRDGSDLLLAGQKSGVLYALEPAQGRILWEIRLGRGGSLGGIEWGTAADAGVAYVAVADWNVGSTEADGALSAVDLETGKRIWRTPNPFDACQKRHHSCSIANAAPVTAIPGVAFLGSLDGYLRAYDALSGRILWDFDTNIEVEGVNQAKGHGGSINAAGVTVANGMLYQTSGYAAFGLGMPGNVLLAFSVEKKQGEEAQQVAPGQVETKE